jgi:hypothetical protein
MYLHHTQIKCLRSINCTLCVTHMRSVKSGSLYDTSTKRNGPIKWKLILPIEAAILDSTLKRTHLFPTDLTKFNLTFKLFHPARWHNFPVTLYAQPTISSVQIRTVPKNLVASLFQSQFPVRFRPNTSWLINRKYRISDSTLYMKPAELAGNEYRKPTKFI